MESAERATIPLDRHAYVRYRPLGVVYPTSALTTRLATLRYLPKAYDSIADSRAYVILGIWVDGIGRINGNAAETFVRTIARRIAEENPPIASRAASKFSWISVYPSP